MERCAEHFEYGSRASFDNPFSTVKSKSWVSNIQMHLIFFYINCIIIFPNSRGFLANFVLVLLHFSS